MVADAGRSNDAPTRRRIRSFVRREGRLTPAQKLAIDELLPRYSAKPTGDDRINPSALFGRDAALTIEIGFGNGDTLLQLAQKNPQRNYIGIEVHRPGVGRLLRGIEDGELENLRVATDDAVDFIRDFVAPDSVDELLLYFPDPWHKKRHHKRRIVTPEFARLAASRLRPGGRWYLATDWADYAQQMLAVLDREPLLSNLGGAGGVLDTRRHRPETHFERRGRGRGHEVFDLGYERVDLQPESNDV